MKQIPAGRLEVVCGSMFSGKTEELLRRLRRAEIAGKRVLTIKNQIDDRSGKATITTHNGRERAAHPLENKPEHLWSILDLAKNADVIGFDEIHFFDREVILIIRELIESGKRVILAGLDLDFRGEAFSVVAHLLALADDIIKLKAICVACGENAHYTQRIVNNAPASYYDPIILVGAAESYKAHCRRCFVILDRPTTTRPQSAPFIGDLLNQSKNPQSTI